MNAPPIEIARLIEQVAYNTPANEVMLNTEYPECREPVYIHTLERMRSEIRDSIVDPIQLTFHMVFKIG